MASRASPATAGEHIHFWDATVRVPGLDECVECRQYSWRSNGGRIHTPQRCLYGNCQEPARHFSRIRERLVFRCTVHSTDWPQ